MDRNLEIRQNICIPVKETMFDKFLKWIAYRLPRKSV